jgi:CRP/FNR family transcriptional regulator
VEVNNSCIFADVIIITIDMKYTNTCTVYNRKLSCFEELSEEERDLIDANKVVVNYEKGETICKQGSFASHIIFLKEGLVKVYLEGTPKNLILKISPHGNLIGLPSIYEGNNIFLYSAATYTKSVVEMIDIAIFKRIISQNPKFALKVINVLNENTVQIYGRFYCLTHKQMHGRFADILLCLAQRIFYNMEFELPFTRIDLAELTGMSTESVIRVMKDFKDDGLIEITGKRIKVINYDKMLRISEIG